MPKLPQSQRMLCLLLAGIIFLSGFTVVFGLIFFLPAPKFIPNAGGEINSRAWIGIEFPQPMRHTEVEERLRIDSGTAFSKTWEGNTLWLRPQVIPSPGSTISVRLEPGAHGADGRIFLQLIEKRLTIRQPAIMYLSTLDHSLWASSMDGSDQHQVSQKGARVKDFSVSFDGEKIVYSVINGQNGVDLWRVDRDGINPALFLNCAADQCFSPTWSPLGTRLAYLRLGKEEAYARPWLLDIVASQSTHLIDEPGLGGADLTWSPDGRYCAVYDLPGKTIRIMDFITGQSILIKNQAQTAGSWSPDGQQFYYYDQSPSNLPPVGKAYVLDMMSHQVTELFSRSQHPLDYGLPVPAPGNLVLLVSRRLLMGSPSIQLWLLNADASQEEVISGDFLTTKGAYSWDPAGEHVVFQQLTLGSSKAEPDVMLWERNSRVLTVLARQAAHPQWLP